jgi:Pentapeptide repeats (8 copies)
MANKDHVLQLNKGPAHWNRWRKANEAITPSLTAIDLRGSNLKGLNLRSADLRKARFDFSKIYKSSLRNANLTEANFDGTYIAESDLTRAMLVKVRFLSAWITRVKLRHANLRGANLSGAKIHRVDLRDADLSNADLMNAGLVDLNLKKADLTGCAVYGTSAWDLQLEGANQSNLVITHPMDSVITVDNIEIAQFVYLLINNEKIREVIDSITSKVVLILGRFTPERKAVLDAIRDDVRSRNYLPIVFDFDKPSSRDTVETISTPAHMARFVIADLTDAKSVLQELQRIVPTLPSVPIQPLLQSSQNEPGMLDHMKAFGWFLELYRYDTIADLKLALDEKVLFPAEKRVREGR